ncbi:Thiopurine S-methyltransferase (TPMT) [Verrucomicrobium sp. GAS474]|uniref:methyltransferase domain-containing protein n=1 Tax=Verrucomicrobium sp. GAS474 TaxID=1882831 RepID=UPI00087B3F88|nr:methyltransferase domain-containing protein [Verrucomicrobium sp. GAS474]SDT86433.1 Thiopurine S-methyltransferase (TPMT) [Verrucomicrobium sp. GAS474]
MSSSPSPTDWQARYEAADTPWDKGVAAPPLVDYLARHPMSGSILVPGCGRGHEVRALAAAPGARVTGLDLAPTAVEQARGASAGMTERPCFLEGDFLHPMPAEWGGPFDWIVEHTCFCAILPSERPAYARATAALLRPGGKLFAIFYMTPGHDDGPPFGSAPEELDGLFSPVFRLLEEWVPTTAFPGREGRERVRILERQ